MSGNLPALPCLKAAALTHESISHGFFTRAGGVSTGLYATLNGGVGSEDDPAHVRENRTRMARTLGVLPANLLVPFQVHSIDVLSVSEPFSERPRADGLVTATRGLALGATGADCGMVLFADVQAGVIGACHSGWKGAFDDIIGAVVTTMCALGAQRHNISAVLGPCIQQSSYEVGPEFFTRFIARDAALAAFFVPSARPDHYRFDLPGLIGLRAQQAGIGHFESLGLDTYADADRFFSYRRSTHLKEPDYGRLISAIALV